ncbi:MAG: metal-dependent transcriptional regulator [Firmicutes bacterium]|nr:metal-dependent transcriptional regulator [Bacillota bacterium]
MEADVKGISKALETYLEVIYVLALKKSYVRITDISVYLGISKPSVNRAVNTLKSNGYVLHEPYGDITLTEKGRAIAEKVYNNHYIIKTFFTDILKISREDAEKEAISVGHSISAGTIDRMVQYMNRAVGE